MPPKEEKKPAGPPISRRWFPKIDRLAIDDGKLVFRDPTSDTELDMNVSNVMGASNEQALELTGRGRLQKEQFTLDARGVRSDSLAAGQAFSRQRQSRLWRHRGQVSGTIAELLQLEGPDLRLEPMGPTWPCRAL